MNNEDLIKLINNVQESVIHILLLHELVELVNNKDGFVLANIKPSHKGEDILGVRMYFTDEWFKSIRDKWPVELRGTSKITKHTCQKFIANTGASLSKIENIIDYWLKSHEKPYCGRMDNFFYKIENDQEISRAEDLLDIVNESTEKDYRFEQV